MPRPRRTSATRLAVIDIGSASARVLVADVDSAGNVAILAERREPTRLAAGIAESGRLSPSSMKRTCEAIKSFAAFAKQQGASIIQAFATAAVRDAENRDEFVKDVRKSTSLDVRIVSERDECLLAFEAAARAFELDGHVAVADLGGGSLDVVRAIDSIVVGSASMKLGAVRLTDRFGGPEACRTRNFAAIRTAVRKTLRDELPALPDPPRFLAATGGGFTSLLTMAAARRAALDPTAAHPARSAGSQSDSGVPSSAWDDLMRSIAGLGSQRAPKRSRLSARDLAHANPVSHDEVRTLLAAVRKRTPAELAGDARHAGFPGLPPDRADIAVAALVVVDELMRALRVKAVHVFPGGIREALARRVRANATAPSADSHDAVSMLASARNLATSARYPMAHSEQVARLAVSIYDQLAEHKQARGILKPTAADRALLEAAAVLHDVGMLVEYRAHHKHSAEIIRHAPLPAWDDASRDLLAQIARYHRRSDPTTDHPPFAALSREDRRRVRALAAILRIADGLDRCHRSNARSIRLEFSRDAIDAPVSLRANPDAIRDINTSKKKAALFEEIFGLRWRPRPATTRSQKYQSAGGGT